MTKAEVLEHLCITVSLVYKTIDDYTQPSDGFCHRCPFHDKLENFKHAGITLNYIREAVLEKLKMEGLRIAEGYDPKTGDELPCVSIPQEKV